MFPNIQKFPKIKAAMIALSLVGPISDANAFGQKVFKSDTSSVEAHIDDEVFDVLKNNGQKVEQKDGKLLFYPDLNFPNNPVNLFELNNEKYLSAKYFLKSFNFDNQKRTILCREREAKNGTKERQIFLLEDDARKKFTKPFIEIKESENINLYNEISKKCFGENIS